MTPCPRYEHLEQLLAEQLAETERSAVEFHVEGCAACQQALGRMAGDAPGEGEGRSRHPLGTSLLRRLEEALPRPAADPVQGGGHPPATTPQKDFPAAADGPQVAGYEVLGELGRGGMGVVWKARHVRLDRLVALKMIRAGAQADALDLERFRREAEAVARLQHPHIVQIHEVGEADGRPYLALEYVAGGSLAQRLDGTPLPARQAAQLVQTLAHAVQAAHQCGVVHRDLKPRNILLTATGEPKVADFGLAKRLDVVAAHTQTGALLGTPSYMAPEQAGGKREAVGPLVDVYALGAVLYELLTGRPPFRAETALDTLLQVQTEEPVPPSRLQPKVPRDLETVCLKCLQKEPPRRYATAEALADDLHRFLNGEPVRARPVGPLGRLGRWARRRPGLAGVTASLALLLVLVAAGSSATALYLNATLVESEKRKDRAETAERDAQDQLWRSHRDRARALRFGGQAGQRFDSLKALADAARIARPLQVGDEEILKLRNEAVASLALADLRFERTLQDGVQYYWIAIDPEFRYFVWSDTEGNVRIHRVADGEETARLPCPDQPPSGARLGFSPDGRRLAVSFDLPGRTEFHVWEFADGKAALPVVLPWATAARLDFSPDSRLLAVRRKDQNGRTIGIYEAATGREVKRLPFAGSHVAFHPDGRHLGFSTIGDRFVRVVDVETGQEVARYEQPEVPEFVAWRRDGRLLAVGCGDQRIYVWDHAQGRMQSVLEGHTSGGELVFKFSHGGDFLISTSWDNTTRLWDPVTGRQLVVLAGHHFVDLRRDDRQAALVRFGERSNDLGVWEVAGGWECRTLHHGLVGNRTPRPVGPEPEGVDFSPDGRLLVSGGIDGARLWDLATFAEAGHVPADRTAGALFHPDGNSLFTYGRGGLLRWPLRRETTRPADQPDGAALLQVGLAQTLDVPANWTYPGINLDRRGRLLAAVDYPRNRVIVLDLDAPGKKVDLGEPGVGGCALSPDGRWAVTWPGADHPERSPKVWDTSSGKVVWEPPAGEAIVLLTPDGRWLVTSPPGDAPLRSWQLGSWEPGPTLPKHAPKQVGFVPSPDGTVLVEGGPPNLVAAATGKGLATLEAPHDGSASRGRRFSPDGTRLAVLTGNHTVHVWDLRAIRRGLAEIGLDWDLPPYPPAGPQDATPLTVIVDPGAPPDAARKPAPVPDPKR